MARVLILGGGFGGVVAAERLAERLSDEHQITWYRVAGISFSTRRW